MALYRLKIPHWHRFEGAGTERRRVVYKLDDEVELDEREHWALRFSVEPAAAAPQEPEKPKAEPGKRKRRRAKKKVAAVAESAEPKTFDYDYSGGDPTAYGELED